MIKQNWIGGTRPESARFVPPPVSEMHKALHDFEVFIHKEDTLPIIIKAGLIHAQFETIHPFLDGNGRTGRMLINFYLWKERYLEKPVLFLSSYFQKHQELYYEKLSAYHNGDVTCWINFFIDGVSEIAQEAIQTVSDITLLREKDLMKIQQLGKRASESATMVLPNLYKQPIVNVALLQKWTGFTRAGAQTVINRFIDMNILYPKDIDKKYGQSYIYSEYVSIFETNQ
ncbi:MAG: Fic family protein [Candidatus Roizmanbacteria bacterium]|nr:Fic family protein [Candidatus Roizmanbacteria bacterium]